MEALDEKERPYNFIPKKHSCLRHVAGYANLVKERFERCLDLYLCPRKLKVSLSKLFALHSRLHLFLLFDLMSNSSFVFLFSSLPINCLYSIYRDV